LFKEINLKSDYEIKFANYNNAYYLNGRGFDNDGGHVIFRQQVKITKIKDGSQKLELMRNGESCTGVNCKKCSFAADGGCNCDRAGEVGKPSYCNHIIEIITED